MIIRGTQVLVLALSLSTSTAISVAAQGRGGGQSKGQRTTTGQAGGTKRGQPGQGQSGQGKSTQDHKRIHATDQQRDQLRTCDNAADQVRQRARDLAHTAGGAGFDAAQVGQQRDQLRDRIQTMQQEHDRFMQGLNQEQKTQWQDRLRVMEQQRDRIRQQQQAMEQEFNQANPNGKAIAKQARETERAMTEWQKQYRKMTDETVVPPKA